MGAFPVPYSSPEQYLDFDRGSETKHEYLEGTILAKACASPRHGMLAIRMAGLLDGPMREKGCVPFSSDVRVQVVAKRGKLRYGQKHLSLSFDLLAAGSPAYTPRTHLY